MNTTGGAASFTERATINEADSGSHKIIAYGAGSIYDAINPAGYGCSKDYGYWLHDAGIVQPGIADCNNDSVIGEPTYIHLQVIGEIAAQPTPTHKWWGLWTMTDAALTDYVTAAAR